MVLYTGGAIQIVIYSEALSDAADTNPAINSVDSFTASLLDVIELRDVYQRCAIELGINDVGDLLIVFQRLTTSDARFCNSKIKVCLHLWGTSTGAYNK